MVKLDFNKKGIKLYNGNCFDVFKNIKDKTIDLFVLDLPYGQTACEWDTCIDLKQMWIDIKRIMKPSAILCFFCTTKFGYQLIKSNEKWFKYDLIWQKSRKVGFLSANKRQLRNHENIYVFSNDNNDDIEIKRNIELRKYAGKVKQYINKPLKQINKDMKNRQAEHFFYITSSQFGIPTEKTYKKLIGLYKIDKMEGFLKYKDMVKKWEKNPISTYNPQKTEGTPYKNGAIKADTVYGFLNNEKGTITKTDRHPTSIIEHENIYVFSNDNNDDIEIKRNIELRKYAGNVKQFINKTKTEIIKECGQGLDHFFRISSSQFGLPIEKNYKKLIELYNIDKMEGFLKYKDMVKKWQKIPPIPHTYNPQKTEGKPYKTKENDITGSYYRFSKSEYKSKPIDNKGDRYPTSIIDNETTILKYNNPHKTIHRTEKPVGLLEYLIKTYSNEGETVMDFTMGSGSCGVACYNTKRKFIGVEMDKEIYKLTKNRIEEHLKK